MEISKGVPPIERDIKGGTTYREGYQRGMLPIERDIKGGATYREISKGVLPIEGYQRGCYL